MQSYKLTNLPENMYLSPSYLFDWWDGVIAYNGADAALNDKRIEFKIARELWIAAMFAAGKRKLTSKEHWVRAVKDNAPDAIVAYFQKDPKGYGELKYSLEITTFGKYSKSIENVLKAKLNKSYPDYTRIVCYISDREKEEPVEPTKISEFVNKNNPNGYEVWLLSSVASPIYLGKRPFRLLCLTQQEGVDFDYDDMKQVKNMSEAFKITGKGTSKSGFIEKIGRIKLEFPPKDKPSGKVRT